MSLIKINDQLISVQDLTAWISSFISFYDSGRLKKTPFPEEVSDILKDGSGRTARAEQLYTYLMNSQSFLKTIQRAVKNEVTQDVLDNI